jgi:hypothetical protein
MSFSRIENRLLDQPSCPCLINLLPLPLASSLSQLLPCLFRFALSFVLFFAFSFLFTSHAYIFIVANGPPPPPAVTSYFILHWFAVLLCLPSPNFSLSFFFLFSFFLLIIFLSFSISRFSHSLFLSLFSLIPFVFSSNAYSLIVANAPPRSDLNLHWFSVLLWYPPLLCLSLSLSLSLSLLFLSLSLLLLLFGLSSLSFVLSVLSYLILSCLILSCLLVLSTCL